MNYNQKLFKKYLLQLTSLLLAPPGAEAPTITNLRQILQHFSNTVVCTAEWPNGHRRTVRHQSIHMRQTTNNNVDGLSLSIVHFIAVGKIRMKNAIRSLFKFQFLPDSRQLPNQARLSPSQGKTNIILIVASFASLVALINFSRLYNSIQETQTLRLRRTKHHFTNVDLKDNSFAAFNESIVQSESSKDVDHTESIRAMTNVASHNTIMDSIFDIERKYKNSLKCKSFGGSVFLKSLQDSELSLLTKDSLSNLKSFRNHAMDIFMAENVSIVVNNVDDEQRREFILEINGAFQDEESRSRIGVSKSIGDSKLRNMTLTMKERHDGIPECLEYFDYTAMLIDSNIDTWNWWFFLVSVLKHFVTLGVVESHNTGNDGRNLRLFSTLNDGQNSRPFTDIFALMFDSHRAGKEEAMGVRQIWKEVPISHSMDKKGDENSKRYCFRKLIWSPGGTQGGNEILINQSHMHSDCFSSIVYSYAMHLKTAMHISPLPRPTVPVVVWVARDTSPQANPTQWQSQRIISNQDQVTLYLKEKCNKMGIDFIVASFYGETSDTAALDQALFVSRANIMIGIHGAGLNMFHFMPFYSVVVELHLGTNAQKNSENYVNHIYEGKYIGEDARIKKRGRDNYFVALDEEATWEILKNAIHEWKKLPEKLKGSIQ
jgi:hypothetical protein